MTKSADLDVRFWAETLHETDTLYKDIPIGGLFSFQKEGAEDRVIYEKLKTGFRYADGRKQQGLFKTGQRTAIHEIKPQNGDI